MKRLTKQELVDLVMASYEAEKTGNVEKNLTLVSEDFRFTDMVIAPDDTIFPTVGGEDARELMRRAFPIKGREFMFKAIAADEQTQTVFVEFVESYPDPDTKKVYRTPQVAICEIQDGRIHRTRHYMDPRLSFKYLDQATIDKALGN